MNDDKFVKAYDSLMAHLYELTNNTLHTVADALELAKQKTSKLSGLTQEEINKTANYLMRDIEHATDSMSGYNAADSLSKWLKFDVALIENFALDAFASIADKTRIELAKIENQAKTYSSYHSGEITGAGSFSCNQCNKHIAFKSTSKIPVCPICKATTFSRQ